MKKVIIFLTAFSVMLMPCASFAKGKNRHSTSHHSQKKAKHKKSSSYSCDGKRTCGQMSSCSEARFYLENCGVSRLDRDKDGIPCESICN